MYYLLFLVSAQVEITIANGAEDGLELPWGKYPNTASGVTGARADLGIQIGRRFISHFPPMPTPPLPFLLSIALQFAENFPGEELTKLGCLFVSF